MKLRIEKGFEAGRVIEADSELVTIGRAADNDIVVSDTMVSQHHAKIWRDLDGKMSVTDMESINGTEVNGRAVQTAELRAGDRVLIGKTVIRVVDDGSPPIVAQPAGRAQNEKRREAQTSVEPRRSQRAVEEEEEVVPARATAEATIDLGFEERKSGRERRTEQKDSAAPAAPVLLSKRVKMVALIAVGIVLLAVIGKIVSDRLSGPTFRVAPKHDTTSMTPTEIYYEVVMGSVGDPKNPQVRRFEVRLKDGKLEAALDAPKHGQGQRLRKDKQLNEEELRKLLDSLKLAQLIKVQQREKITQLNAQTYFYTELRVTQGDDYKEFLIRNTEMPDEVKTTVDELMAQVELHLEISNVDAEQRLREATAKFEEATRYQNDPTQPANLYRAWKRYAVIIKSLEDLEPKPPVYLESKKRELTTRQELEDKAEKNMQSARVHIQMREWVNAERPLKENMEMVDGNENDAIYKKAFEEWQRRVLPNLPRK